MADPESPDNPQEEGRPEWLPQNFDSPEALAQSYKELQGQFTRVSQEKSAIEDNFAEIASRLDELSVAQQQPQQQYVDPNSQAQYLSEQLGVEPEYLSAMAFIAQQTTQQLLNQQSEQWKAQTEASLSGQYEINQRLAADSLRAKYPDWDTKVDRIRETLESTPGLVTDQDMLSADTLANKFESVYKQVTYDELVNGAGEAGDQTNIADMFARMKMGAQTATGASGRPDPVSDEKALWDAVKNAKPATYYNT